jgi:hypothetical protein
VLLFPPSLIIFASHGIFFFEPFNTPTFVEKRFSTVSIDIPPTLHWLGVEFEFGSSSLVTHHHNLLWMMEATSWVVGSITCLAFCQVASPGKLGMAARVACPEECVVIGGLCDNISRRPLLRTTPSYFTKSEQSSAEIQISRFNMVVVWLMEMGYMAGCW